MLRGKASFFSEQLLPELDDVMMGGVMRPHQFHLMQCEHLSANDRMCLSNQAHPSQSDQPALRAHQGEAGEGTTLGPHFGLVAGEWWMGS